MIKVYRKGTITFYKSKGIQIAVADSALPELYAVSQFLGQARVPDMSDALPAPRRQRKGKGVKLPQASVDTTTQPATPNNLPEFNVAEEIEALIVAGVNTEAAIVGALRERLTAAGKKSPERSVNTALRHAKTRGRIKESSEGTFSLVPQLKAV